MLPHSSLNGEIPYFVETGRRPNVSWLLCFGCSAVVHSGKDLVEHGKLAPCGEHSVFVGLGLMHGRKS
eukprot:556587-Rhodomonas_salina.1